MNNAEDSTSMQQGIIGLNPVWFEVLLMLGCCKSDGERSYKERHQIEKFYKLKSQLQGVSLRIQVLMKFVLLIG